MERGVGVDIETPNVKPQEVLESCDRIFCKIVNENVVTFQINSNPSSNRICPTINLQRTITQLVGMKLTMVHNQQLLPRKWNF